MEKIRDFWNNMKKYKIAFVGFGVSHTQTVRRFAREGLDVTVCDKSETIENRAGFESLGVKFITGENYLDTLQNFDVILRTPGMSFNHQALTAARRQGCIVTSELELFFELCPCPIYAITGSDGKTTTTTLISELLKSEGKTVHLGGNIGRPLLPIIDEVKSTDLCVVELSSFQLISMRRSPDVAVITNISPNHLDVHSDMEEYVGSKRNIVIHQDAFSKTVLNLENEITRSFEPLVRGRCTFFSLIKQPSAGAFLSGNGMLSYFDGTKITEIIHSREIILPGAHNIDNYLAAITAVWGEVQIDKIITIAKTFAGVEHRLEFVRNIGGVKYYNDSIATTPTRTIAALNSFSRKIILLAGGYDKKIPFDPLVPYILDKVKILILAGDTAEKIEQAIKSYPQYEKSGLVILRAENIAESVALAHQNSANGDIVSLSPACASFDAYKNFEARGKNFKELVLALQN